MLYSDMWQDLEDMFHINKYMKFIQLDIVLCTITQCDFDVSSYCTCLKSIVDMFDNINSLVLEKNRVIYVINGLNLKF